MTTIVSMLRGVNVGGHNKIRMDALRALCESLGLRDPETYVQSGNIVFTSRERDLARLAGQIENAIEQQFGFRPDVILRTCSDLKDVIARNPFPKRRGMDPSKLLVTFLPGDPGPDARDKILRIKADPEEVRLDGRELFTYSPDGIARSKLLPAIAKMLIYRGTSRNWNTVTKLFEIAESIESG